MATVTARTLPWYAPPRVARAMRQARRYPLVPLAMLTFLLVIPAVLAPQVAPHDPLKGSLAKRLKPPVWQEGGSIEHPLGTDKLGPRHPEPDHLRRPRLARGVAGGDLRRRRHRHRPRADVGLLRRLGRLADHAAGGHLAVLADDLARPGPGRRRGPELRHGDHRARGAALGALRAAGPRRDPQHQGAGLHRPSAGGRAPPTRRIMVALHLPQRRQLARSSWPRCRWATSSCSSRR